MQPDRRNPFQLLCLVAGADSNGRHACLWYFGQACPPWPAVLCACTMQAVVSAWPWAHFRYSYSVDGSNVAIAFDFGVTKGRRPDHSSTSSASTSSTSISYFRSILSISLCVGSLTLMFTSAGLMVMLTAAIWRYSWALMSSPSSRLVAKALDSVAAILVRASARL